jgi:hypothetical protein
LASCAGSQVNETLKTIGTIDTSRTGDGEEGAVVTVIGGLYAPQPLAKKSSNKRKKKKKKEKTKKTPNQIKSNDGYYQSRLIVKHSL